MLSRRLSLRALKADVVESKSFGSVRSFIVYLGPALIVSMAYMDPGNYGTDLIAGSNYKYELIWAVWMASIMAMILQYLSGKLGIASGKSLAELVKESLGRRSLVLSYWISAELAAAATDLAEYLGTVIALNILFGVPMLYAAIFGALDVLLIMTLMNKKFHLIEQFFILSVSIIAVGFLFEAIMTRPSITQIIVHTFSPTVSASTIPLVVGIIGATVMPHALFVHSWLTRNKLTSTAIEEKRRLRKLHRNETIVLLSIAAVVNVGILLVAIPLKPNPDLTIGQAYQQLGLAFGAVTGVVFIVTLLMSGLASSTTGTIAGQAIMEDLLGKRVNPWVRRVVTRFVNVFPTTIAILLKFDPLKLLVYSQIILSIMIPLPMIPLIYYTSKKKFMGEFTNRRITIVVASIIAAMIVGFNAYLILTSV